LVKNRQKPKLNARDILGKKVLLLGESGSGKTRMAAAILQQLMTLTELKNITAVDFAPNRVGQIGGKLTDYVTPPNKAIYLSPRKVYAPRLTATSPEQLLRYAELNRKMMEPLLDKFLQNSTKVLVINDITLYLHLGALEKILQCTRLATTFLATAYYGSKLAEDLGTGISSRERQLTDKLATCMDSVVRID